MIPLAEFHAFRCEFEKLARSAPKRKKDVERVEAAPPPVAARAMGGMLGAGMIAGQVPLLKGYGAGRGTYYHATTPGAAAGITANPMGIDPSFAGAGVRAGANDYLSSVSGAANGGVPEAKKARINRYLMGESLNRVLESHGAPMGHEDLVGNLDHFNTLMDQGMQASEASQHVAKNVTDRLVSSGKMTPQQAAAMHQTLSNELPSFGRRVYMGTHASDVLPWASGKSEGQMALDKAMAMGRRVSSQGGMAQQQMKSVADAMTGGLMGTFKSMHERMKFKPHAQEHMTMEQANQELQRLHQSGQKAGVIFGAEVPTGQMGYMQDFPVVKHLVNLNPGLKSTLSQFSETYEPGRDLSIPHNIPTKNIRSVDIVDHATGNIRRLHISDFQRAARSSLGQRAKNLAAPLAISALGGNLIYRGLKPRKKMVPKGSPLAKDKTSSVAGDVGHFAKHVLPVAAGAGALGIGAHTLMRKALPPSERRPQGLKEETQEGAKMFGRTVGSGLLTGGASAGIGALAGPAIARRMGLPTTGARQLGAGVAGAGALMFGMPAVMGSEQALNPEADPFYAPLPDKVHDTLRAHPYLGGIGQTAMAAALPVASAYTLRKYYPGTYSKAALSVKDLLNKARSHVREAV